jgi:hypothetical protein
MQKACFSWNLFAAEHDLSVEKHCKMCGKSTIFTDTLVRRHNANGKNIYRYAIYKCGKNHTWNMKLSEYKSYPEHVRLFEPRKEAAGEKADVYMEKLIASGHTELEIKITGTSGNDRLDKVLSERLIGWSRSLIVKKVKEGSIQVNKKGCKPSSRLQENDCVLIMI